MDGGQWSPPSDKEGVELMARIRSQQQLMRERRLMEAFLKLCSWYCQ